MGTKYTSQSSSGYNASPPSDDGTTSEANKVKWSTIKTKLSDVLKTFTEAINSQLVTALNTSARAVSASDSAASTDHWKTIQVNTASVTVTLADAATMAAGYIVEVANQSAGDITVALASATDTIDTVTNTTQTISAKEARRYIVNAAMTGYITVGDRTAAASDTVDGTIEIATQAEMETASSTTLAVTPGRQQFHPSALKAWVVATTGGVATVGYNVSSVTDTGPGEVTVNFTTAFSSANYCVTAIPKTTWANAATGALFCSVGNSGQAAGSVLIDIVRASDGAHADPASSTMIMCSGDQ